MTAAEFLHDPHVRHASTVAMQSLFGVVVYLGFAFIVTAIGAIFLEIEAWDNDFAKSWVFVASLYIPGFALAAFLFLAAFVCLISALGL